MSHIPTPIFSFGGNNNILKFLFMDLNGLGVLDFQDKAERLPYNDDFDQFVATLEERFNLVHYQVEWYKSHSNVSVRFTVMYGDHKGPGYSEELHGEAISFIADYFNGGGVYATHYASGKNIYKEA
jgi:hypothetical protein